MTRFTLPQYYTNRELSWLDFNDRVFEEARDKLIRYSNASAFGITQSNVDEFFMVRVVSYPSLPPSIIPNPMLQA